MLNLASMLLLIADTKETVENKNSALCTYRLVYPVSIAGLAWNVNNTGITTYSIEVLKTTVQ